MRPWRPPKRIPTTPAALEHTGSDGKRYGRGVAAGFWGNNTGPAAAVALVNPDGTVTLTEGSPDIGGTRASVSQQLAEVLGIPVEDVRPQIGDTDSIGFTSNTGGSSVTFKTGFAAYTAAQDVKQQMIARAARIWEVEPEDVLYEDGVLTHRADDQLRSDLPAAGGPPGAYRRPHCRARRRQPRRRRPLHRRPHC